MYYIYGNIYTKINSLNITCVSMLIIKTGGGGVSRGNILGGEWPGGGGVMTGGIARGDCPGGLPGGNVRGGGCPDTCSKTVN